MALRDHGKSRTPVYKAWVQAHQRCNNPKNPNFPRYGGRGIYVCDRWTTFKPFLEDMGERPAANLSIDRIDNDGPYSPENCRWATKSQQMKNRSRFKKFNKLDPIKVRLIRLLAQTGMERKKICERYDVQKSIVGKIINFKIHTNI